MSYTLTGRRKKTHIQFATKCQHCLYKTISGILQYLHSTPNFISKIPVCVTDPLILYVSKQDIFKGNKQGIFSVLFAQTQSFRFYIYKNKNRDLLLNMRSSKAIVFLHVHEIIITCVISTYLLQKWFC